MGSNYSINALLSEQHGSTVKQFAEHLKGTDGRSSKDLEDFDLLQDFHQNLLHQELLNHKNKSTGPYVLWIKSTKSQTLLFRKRHIFI